MKPLHTVRTRSRARVLHHIGAALLLVLGANINPVEADEAPATEAVADEPFVTDNGSDREGGAGERELRLLTEITITASPFAPSLLEYNRPATVLDREEITEKAQTTIGETIGNEPGVSSSYFGPGASRPVIRGNAGERIRVLKNGVGTLDVSNASEDHAVTTNPLTAESIEILRGPETLLFGNSAIGGVVNITDNTIPERPVEEPLTGTVDVRGGTADDELTGAGVIEGQAGGFNWHLDGFHQDTEDIDIPGRAESDRLRAQEAAQGEAHEEGEDLGGTLEDSATRSRGATAGGSYVWEKGFVGIAVNGYSSIYDVPGHAHEEGGEQEEASGEEQDLDGAEEENGVSIDVEQVRVNVRGRVDEFSALIENLKFKLGISNYDHKELEGSQVATLFENDAIEGRVEMTHAPLAGIEGVLGFQLNASDFSAVGEEAFLPATETISPAVFLFEQYPLSDFWKLHAGGRYEFIHYTAHGFDDDGFQPLSLSTGLIWDPTGRNDYSVSLSIATTQRAPAATELFANGPHVARQTFEIGDPELDVERSYGFDLSMKKNTGLLTGALNLFLQDYRDYINLAGTTDEEDGLPIFAYESVRARFWGFEAETSFHLHKVLDLWTHDVDLTAQLDMVRAVNRTTGDDLPRIPPLRTIIGLEYGYKTDFGAAIEAVFVKEQDRVAEFELPTDSYQLLNASAHVRLPIADAYDWRSACKWDPLRRGNGTHLLGGIRTV